MKGPKSVPRNALRRKHLLDGFCWSAQSLQVLSLVVLSQAPSSKKGVFPSTWRARRWPVTLAHVRWNPSAFTMGPARTCARARAHVRSRYLKGVSPLTRGKTSTTPEVTVSKNEWP